MNNYPWQKSKRGIWHDRYHPLVYRLRGEGINRRKRPPLQPPNTPKGRE